MRLWKALFYCYWMSDKGPVQRELAERLAALINVCPNQAQVRASKTLRILVRQWPRSSPMCVSTRAPWTCVVMGAVALLPAA